MVEVLLGALVWSPLGVMEGGGVGLICNHDLLIPALDLISSSIFYLLP